MMVIDIFQGKGLSTLNVTIDIVHYVLQYNLPQIEYAIINIVTISIIVLKITDKVSYICKTSFVSKTRFADTIILFKYT